MKEIVIARGDVHQQSKTTEQRRERIMGGGTQALQEMIGAVWKDADQKRMVGQGSGKGIEYVSPSKKSVEDPDQGTDRGK